jgi:hypothetical protein
MYVAKLLLFKRDYSGEKRDPFFFFSSEFDNAVKRIMTPCVNSHGRREFVPVRSRDAK